jgi:hypothetical protein
VVRPSRIPTSRPPRRRSSAAKRANGELDSDNGKWGGWKYQGDRSDCFYVVGRRCYKTEKAACTAARCKANNQQCDVVGGGPASITCKKSS